MRKIFALALPALVLLALAGCNKEKSGGTESARGAPAQAETGAAGILGGKHLRGLPPRRKAFPLKEEFS